MNMWQNLNKDENGFLHIELLILMAIFSMMAIILFLIIKYGSMIFLLKMK